MRQIKTTRMVTAFVGGLLLGSIPLVLDANDPPLAVPELGSADLAPTPDDPTAREQLGRALRGEKVKTTQPALQDVLNVANEIGSVLNGSSLDPRNESGENSQNPAPDETRAQPPGFNDLRAPLRGTSRAFAQQQGPRSGIGRVSGETQQNTGRFRDDDRMPAPQLVPRIVTPIPHPASSPRVPANQEDRFYMAEMMLRTARLLGEVSPSDASRQQLVAAMRAEAVRLMGQQVIARPPQASATFSSPRSRRLSTPPTTLAPNTLPHPATSNSNSLPAITFAPNTPNKLAPNTLPSSPPSTLPANNAAPNEFSPLTPNSP